MKSAGDVPPVKAKAVLIDAATLAVLWTNDPTVTPAPGGEGEPASALTVEQIVPMAEAMGVSDALRAVADDGVPRHLRADVVSKASGSVALVVSVYRLPDGALLLVSENAWHIHGKAGEGAARRAPRRGR